VKATIAAAGTAVVVGVATTVLVPVLSGPFDDLIGNATTTGPPIKIHTRLEPAADDVVLPRSQVLSARDVATLSRLSPQDAATWLTAHREGIVADTRSLVLTLTGNRPDPVRITGVDVASSCRPPDRGTMVRMMEGRGGGVDSERMQIDAAKVNPTPYRVGQNGKEQPYFPYRTIVLKKGESQTVVVDVNPTYLAMDDPDEEQVCDVHLTLDLLQGDQESTEKVPATVRVMGVESEAADARYASLYLGTGLCKTFVPAQPGWLSDLRASCGPGNVQDE
jgi:hypothetical protein